MDRQCNKDVILERKRKRNEERLKIREGQETSKI